MSSFLKSGHKLGSDQFLAISPVLIDCWKRCVYTGPYSFANSFRTPGWSSSGPKAIEGFRPLRSFVTPSFVTTISSMNGVGLSRSGTWLCTDLCGQLLVQINAKPLENRCYGHSLKLCMWFGYTEFSDYLCVTKQSKRVT